MYVSVYMEFYGGCQEAKWEAVRLIRFGMYNIRNGQNGGIDSALQGLSQTNVDLGIFQETRVPKGIFTRGSRGYWGVASEAPIAHIGGVAMFYREAEHFTLEALRLHGENVVRFQLTLGGQQWYAVRFYLSS